MPQSKSSGTTSKGSTGNNSVQGRHYPQPHRYSDHSHFTDLRIAYDHIYQMQARMDQMSAELAALKSGAAERGGTSQSGDGGKGTPSQKSIQADQKRSISATHIAGYYVKPKVLAGGEVLTYVKIGNQLEFM